MTLFLSQGLTGDAAEGCLAVFPLRGERVLLRPLAPEHLPALCAAANDAAVSAQTALIPFPYGTEDGAAFLRDTFDAHAQGRSLRLAIERAGDRTFMGMIGLEQTAKGLELGYWLGQDYWGQGFAADAVRQILAHAFDDLGCGTIHAHVACQHHASARVLEKNGFIKGDTARRPFPQRPDGERLCDHWTLDAAGFAQARHSRLLLVTAVALLDSDHRVLLQQRPLDKHMGGLWEFPGGKVDPGETPERALVRELHEELGIDVRESCLAPLTFASHAYDGFHLLMPLYICRSWKGQIHGKEGQKLAWVRGAQLADYPMPPADIPLIPILRDWI